MKMISSAADFARFGANFAGFAGGIFSMPQNLPVFQGFHATAGIFCRWHSRC